MKKRSVFVKFVEASLACLKLSLPIHCDDSIAEKYKYIKNDWLRFVSQFERAKGLLREKRHELETLAKHLLDREGLLKSDVEKLIGVRPYGEERAEDNVIPEVGITEQPE